MILKDINKNLLFIYKFNYIYINLKLFTYFSFFFIFINTSDFYYQKNFKHLKFYKKVWILYEFHFFSMLKINDFLKNNIVTVIINKPYCIYQYFVNKKKINYNNQIKSLNFFKNNYNNFFHPTFLNLQKFLFLLLINKSLFFWLINNYQLTNLPALLNNKIFKFNKSFRTQIGDKKFLFFNWKNI